MFANSKFEMSPIWNAGRERVKEEREIVIRRFFRSAATGAARKAGTPRLSQTLVSGSPRKSSRNSPEGLQGYGMCSRMNKRTAETLLPVELDDELPSPAKTLEELELLSKNARIVNAIFY